MNEELKPCPFCDGIAEVSYFDMDNDNNIDRDCEIKCTECGVLFVFCGQYLTRMAIEAWNKRA